MALGITQYVSSTSTNWGGAGNVGAARTSGSFTPNADAKLYAFMFTECAANWTGTVTDSLGNSIGSGWTQRADTGLITNGNTAGKSRLYLWELDTGSSPSARTVTFTASQSDGAIAYGLFVVTGNSPHIKTGQVATGTDVGNGGAGGDGTVANTNLTSATTNGNLVIAVLGANKDTSNAITAPSGFTALFDVAGGGAYQAPAVFSRTDFTGQSTSSVNTGDLANSSHIVLFEIEESGTPPVFAYDTYTKSAFAEPSTGTKSISHAAGAGARAAVVLISQAVSASDVVSGVTYGGTAMTRVEFKANTSGIEPHAVYVYFLDNIPAGTQTVAMTVTSNTRQQMVVATVKGDQIGVRSSGSNYTAAANPTVTATGMVNGETIIAFEVFHTAYDTIPATPAFSWTYMDGQDIGTEGRAWARVGPATQSGTTLTAGWTLSTSARFCLAVVALFNTPFKAWGKPASTPAIAFKGWV